MTIQTLAARILRILVERNVELNEHNSNKAIKVFSDVISGARLARQLFGSANDCLL